MQFYIIIIIIIIISPLFQISDSFGIQQDAFTPPPTQQPQTLRIEPLKKPPKWMRKPCAARFGVSIYPQTELELNL